MLFHLGTLAGPPGVDRRRSFHQRLEGLPEPLLTEMVAYLQRKCATCTDKTAAAWRAGWRSSAASSPRSIPA